MILYLIMMYNVYTYVICVWSYVCAITPRKIPYKNHPGSKVQCCFARTSCTNPPRSTENNNKLSSTRLLFGCYWNLAPACSTARAIDWSDHKSADSLTVIQFRLSAWVFWSKASVQNQHMVGIMILVSWNFTHLKQNRQIWRFCFLSSVNHL